MPTTSVGMARCRNPSPATFAEFRLGGRRAHAAKNAAGVEPGRGRRAALAEPRGRLFAIRRLATRRNEGKAEEAQSLVNQLTQRRWGFRRGEDRQVDLFSLFSGALAVQESLQLDALRGQPDSTLGDMADPTKNTVKITSLEGPSVKSHPWDKMLAAQMVSGKRPDIGPLDFACPEDQYYSHFRSLSKLLDIIDAGDLWGTHLFAQAEKYAKTQRTGERIKTQLADPHRSAHAAVLRHGGRRGGHHGRATCSSARGAT